MDNDIAVLTLTKMKQAQLKANNDLKERELNESKRIARQVSECVCFYCDLEHVSERGIIQTVGFCPQLKLKELECKKKLRSLKTRIRLIHEEGGHLHDQGLQKDFFDTLRSLQGDLESFD